jgi:hypothetical protein
VVELSVVAIAVVVSLLMAVVDVSPSAVVVVASSVADVAASEPVVEVSVLMVEVIVSLLKAVTDIPVSVSTLLITELANDPVLVSAKKVDGADSEAEEVTTEDGDGRNGPESTTINDASVANAPTVNLLGNILKHPHSKRSELRVLKIDKRSRDS